MNFVKIVIFEKSLYYRAHSPLRRPPVSSSSDSQRAANPEHENQNPKSKEYKPTALRGSRSEFPEVQGSSSEFPEVQGIAQGPTEVQGIQGPIQGIQGIQGPITLFDDYQMENLMDNSSESLEA